VYQYATIFATVVFKMRHYVRFCCFPFQSKQLR